MPGFAFFAKLFIAAAEPGHEADNPFGHMGVEVIADDFPSLRVPVRGEQRLKASHVIGLGAAVTHNALNFAGDNVEGSDQGLRAVADILELAPLYHPWLHGQRWRGAFQRLNAGHLVYGNGAHTFRRGGRGIEIGGTNSAALGFKIGIGLGREPIPDTMGLKRRFF